MEELDYYEDSVTIEECSNCGHYVPTKHVIFFKSGAFCSWNCVDLYDCFGEIDEH